MAARRHELQWSREAFADLEDILDWIEKERPLTTAKVRDRILDAVEGLRDMPLRGRLVPEFELFANLQLREVVVPPWRAIYRVREGAIALLAVVDGRRKIEDLILRRLTRHPL